MTHEEQTSSRATIPPQAATPNEPYYLNRDKRPPNRRSLGIALVVVGLIWLFTTWSPGLHIFSFGSRGTETVFDRTIAATQIQLDAGAADVEIVRGSGEDIRIEAIREGGSDQDYNVNLVQDGNTIRVSHTSSPCVIFCNRSLSYRIALPAETQAEIQTNSGAVHAEDLSGTVAIRTVSGDIELSGISGALKINSTSGEVNVESGNLTSAEINTTSADVTLEGVSDTIQIKTVSGSIDVSEGRDGQLDLSTISGDIMYSGSLANTPANRVNSVSGTVQVALPEDIGLILDASSASGTTETNFELIGTTESHVLRGKIGSGTIPLTIKTTSGDIEVNSR
jgi:hypothetical protein